MTLSTLGKDKLPEGYSYPVSNKDLVTSLGEICDTVDIKVSYSYSKKMTFPRFSKTKWGKNNKSKYSNAIDVLSLTFPGRSYSGESEFWSLTFYAIESDKLDTLKKLIPDGLDKLRYWLSRRINSKHPQRHYLSAKLEDDELVFKDLDSI